MPRILTLIFIVCSIMALSGCGGGSSSGNTGGVPEQKPNYASGINDTMAKHISNARSLTEATTFTARAVGHITGDKNQRATPEDITFQIYRTAPDARATIEVTHSGATTIFTPDNFFESSYSISGKHFWAYGGWMEKFSSADGPTDTKYHIPVEFWFDGTPNMNRLAVIGLETPHLPTGDTARYEGTTRMEVRPKDLPGEWTRYRSDIELTADFSDRSISGVMDAWRTWSITDGNYMEADLDGRSYDLMEAPITNTGFTTTLAHSDECVDCPEIVFSSITGTFYGPEANEAGGTFEVEFDDGQTKYNEIGTGVFFTSQAD